MKVTFIIYSLSSGGAERVTVNLANYWAEKGWDVTILTLSGTETDFYRIHPSVCRIALDLTGESHNFIAGFAANVVRIKAIRKVLRDTKPEIVISMMTTANILLSIASIRVSNLTTIGAERIHPPRLQIGRLWQGLRNWGYGLLDVLVAQTHESELWLYQHTKAKSVAVIPNSIPWPLGEQEPVVSPYKVIKKERKTVLSVGRLQSQKGYDLLLKAFSALASQYPEWDLVIVGEGEDRTVLERQINELDLLKRIKLPGRVGNIGDWYHAADMYVMSSRFEGFPNTLVEAMASGLPVVSFDCDTGPRDIIQHGVDGFLVEKENTEALRHAMSQLMGDAHLRQQLSGRAGDVRKRFSMEKITGMWEQLFKDKRNG